MRDLGALSPSARCVTRKEGDAAAPPSRSRSGWAVRHYGRAKASLPTLSLTESFATSAIWSARAK